MAADRNSRSKNRDRYSESLTGGETSGNDSDMEFSREFPSRLSGFVGRDSARGYSPHESRGVIHDVGTPSLSRLISQAQGMSQESQESNFVSPAGSAGFSEVRYHKGKRKRVSNDSNETESDIDSIASVSQRTRLSNTTVNTANEEWYDVGSNNTPRSNTKQVGEMNLGPKVVIITCADTNLAKMNPIKVAKALTVVGQDSVKNVTKVKGGIAVHCFTAAQALKMKQVTSLGDWNVVVEFPKSETQCKGVIRGMPVDVSEQEILDACGNIVQGVKRLKRREDGKWVDSEAVCLTFSKKVLPAVVTIGFEAYRVKPYVEQVVRCYKCQRLGHMSKSCKGSVRCVRCGGAHNLENCTDKELVKCCRCGQSHSAAYQGCESFKTAKKINSVRANQCVSYSEAVKVVQESTYVAPAAQIAKKHGINQISNNKQNEQMSSYKHNDPRHMQIQKIPSTTNKKVTTIMVADAETQTSGNDVGSQTEADRQCPSSCKNKSTDHTVPLGQQLVYLMSGLLQIYEATKNKGEREKAIEALVQKHIKAERQLGAKHKKGSKDKDSKKGSGSTSGNEKESTQTQTGKQNTWEIPAPQYSYRSCEYRGDDYRASKGKPK